ncbi:rRNA adenine N-6-methyltransferase family protein [Streptomyces niveus]
MEAGPKRLASALMRSGALKTDWLPAYEAAPRHQFVPDTIWPGRAGANRQDDRVTLEGQPDLWWKAVYRDAPITTQWDHGEYTGPKTGRTPTSSNSMPTMVFTMLDALNIREGQEVLEVGTGTGWNAALLSHRLGADHVVSVEVDSRTAEDARNRLTLAGLHPLVHVGNGCRGLRRARPVRPVDRHLFRGQRPRRVAGTDRERRHHRDPVGADVRRRGGRPPHGRR